MKKRKARVKGQAAIITDENYEQELTQAKKKRKKPSVNIKKEKVLENITKKPRIVSNIPGNHIGIPSQQMFYASQQPANNIVLHQNVSQNSILQDGIITEE